VQPRSPCPATSLAAGAAREHERSPTQRIGHQPKRAALVEAVVLAHLEGTDDRHRQQRSDDHDGSAQRASTRPATNRAAMTTTATARKRRPENHGDRIRAPLAEPLPLS